MNDSTTDRSLSRRRSSLRVKVLLFCVTLAVIALVLEAGVRILFPITDCYWYFWDPTLGPRFKPNQSGRRIKGAGIDCQYHINAQGWLHPEDYVYEKPRGARRICLVGDSQVESLQVNPDDAMYRVAQRVMSRSDRPVQWYSFGNSGWGTNLEYEAIRHYALDYQPDVVVLLFLQNDPFDASPYLVDVSRFWPVYALDDADRLLFFPAASDWNPPTLMQACARSAFFRYVMFQKQFYERIKGIRATRGGVGGLPLRVTVDSERKDYVPNLRGMTLEQRKARTWKLIETLLTACRDECRRRGARFAVAFRGWMNEIDAPLTGRPFERSKPPDSRRDCLDDDYLSEMGREVLEPMARRLAIPYLDLTHALQEKVRETGRSHVFVDDMHFTAEAHDAAGRAMAAWVEQILQHTASKQ